MNIKIVALFLIMGLVCAIGVSASAQDKILKRDTSQPIDQGDAPWQQIAIPVNLDGSWRADVIFNHDWSNPAWTICDAFDEAQANQVPYYIYSAELYPAAIAIYISEQFANMWP